MLLRSSISGTKRFFQKTLKNFKSMFSPGYERLPKTPPRSSHLSYSVAGAKDLDMNSNTSYQELDKFHTDFNDQWGDSERENDKRRSKKKSAMLLASPTTMQEKEAYSGGYTSLSNASPERRKNHVEKREEHDNQDRRRSLTHQRVRKKDSKFNSMGMGEHRNCMVEQKLRELEMLDMSNVEYVLDIEEVLHYYSRLTCPAYLEIVDRFFMEMYSEFFGPAWSATATPSRVNSRMKMRYQ